MCNSKILRKQFVKLEWNSLDIPCYLSIFFHALQQGVWRTGHAISSTMMMMTIFFQFGCQHLHVKQGQAQFTTTVYQNFFLCSSLLLKLACKLFMVMIQSNSTPFILNSAIGNGVETNPFILETPYSNPHFCSKLQFFQNKLQNKV